MAYSTHGARRAATSGPPPGAEQPIAAGKAAIPIDTLRLSRWLWTATIAVLGLGVLRALLIQSGAIPRDFLGGLRILDLDGELNLPAWYAAVLMWTIAALLALLARISAAGGRRAAIYFAALGAMFVVLSLDEAVSLHEGLARFVPAGIEAALPPLNGWTLFAAPLLIVGGLVFLPFVVRLPRPTTIAVALAAVLYVLGAFGMEIVASLMPETTGDGWLDGWLYQADVIAEEGLELVGLSLFLTALLTLLAREAPVIAPVAGNAARS